MSELRWIKVDIDSRVPATGDYKLGWNDGDETFCEGLHKGEYFSQYSLTCAQNITHYAGPIVIADPEPELECLKEDSYTPMTPEVKRFIREIEEYTDRPRLTYSEFREWIQPRIAAIWNDPISPKPELEMPEGWTRDLDDPAVETRAPSTRSIRVRKQAMGMPKFSESGRVFVELQLPDGYIFDPRDFRVVRAVNAAVKVLEEEV